MNLTCGAEQLFAAIALSLKLEISPGILKFERLALAVKYLAQGEWFRRNQRRPPGGIAPHGMNHRSLKEADFLMKKP